MSGYTYTLRDTIWYKDIRKSLGVANIKEKMKDKSLKMVWICVKDKVLANW